MQSQGWDGWVERIDWVRAVRGAGTGFGVLVIAGLLWALLGQMGLPWAEVALWVGWPLGFILAARHSGSAPSPVLTGAVAALLAYTLTIPLIYMTRQPFRWEWILAYCVVAMLIGGLAGHLAGRRAAGGR